MTAVESALLERVEKLEQIVTHQEREIFAAKDRVRALETDLIYLQRRILQATDKIRRLDDESNPRAR